ncbi:hypothetical protein IPC1147_34195 [Pseudomonas aeruginosa]|uniref:3'-5' exonuclease n=1 Tax=Pseudomonas aeruginosa TaxID=287 RepID=UPI000FFED136|nr:3'-5' exonuclease [Pseudomonas aeruginosa]MBA5106051.1 3'-5' exonuclease [Pseudomonas aeruginosa]MDP5989986.1 3'-5' exonuclease [Pseudomonas aeruginosa]RRS17185.1 hypothetical protein IPC1107_30560 [Pseudomonas aeruginosa]RRS17623.1 hypothetical protein IPC1147_34195 [Pseudomonas aeruginosa]HCE9175704.1 3'-5' exonuclease [Pseudomonas aeruginosa]
MSINELPSPKPLVERFVEIEHLAAGLGFPIYLVDLETTGFGQHTNVGLVEFASIFVPPAGHTTAFTTLVNPGLPIHWGASKVHGIFEEDIRDAPTFPRLAPPIRQGLKSTLVSGYNSRIFDTKLLQGNAERYGLSPIEAPVQLDVRDIWIALHGRKGKLEDAARYYQVQPGPAHRAHGDVLTTARVLNAMLIEHGHDTVRGSIASAR